jgi:hypothetical protein
MLRATFAALVFVACATPAIALERDDLIGAWETQWSNAPGEAPTGGGPMQVSADTSSDGLDGLTPASGWDGVMNGRVEPGADGALIWSGQWASIWPEGATMGTFRFVFTDADSFTGTWSTDDGEISRAVWNGQRAR